MPDLPAVPNHFVEQALSIAHDWQNNLDKLLTGTGSITPKTLVIDRDGKKYRGRNIPRLAIGEQWEKWVNDNISDCWINTGVAQSLLVPEQGVEDTQATSLHNDTERKFCLFYIIKKDNNDQWTRWYRPTNGPLIPNKKIVYSLRDAGPIPLINIDGEEFQLIDEVCMPLHTWVYADIRILHQASNFVGERIAMHVNFNNDVFDLFGHNTQIYKEQA